MIYSLVIFAITMLVVIIPIWFISMLDEPKRAKALHIAFRLWMNVYMPLVFCPVLRKGKENFKKGETYVVVINHNSLADIPVSSPWIPAPNKTLAKVEMSRVPPIPNYISTLSTRLLAGIGPDVFIYTVENKTALNKYNYVYDLTNEPFVKVYI